MAGHGILRERESWARVWAGLAASSVPNLVPSGYLLLVLRLARGFPARFLWGCGRPAAGSGTRATTPLSIHWVAGATHAYQRGAVAHSNVNDTAAPRKLRQHSCRLRQPCCRVVIPIVWVIPNWIMLSARCPRHSLCQAARMHLCLRRDRGTHCLASAQRARRKS